MAKIPKILIAIGYPSESEIRLLHGIAKYARLHGHWRFHTEQPNDNSNLKKDLLALTESWKPDAIITRIFDVKQIKDIVAHWVPTINLMPLKSRSHYSLLPETFLFFEREPAMTARMGAEYLLKRGLRNFAYFDCIWATYSCKERMDFFIDKIDRVGFKTSVYKPPKSLNKKTQQEEPFIADWLKSLKKPVGIMTCGDVRAIDLASACRIANIKVPDEAAIITTGNDIACDLSDPPLSSIDLNFEKAGYEAAKLLDKLMSGKEKVTTHAIPVYPTTIITRNSTDILAIDDPIVLQALRFIQENTAVMLQVADVADAIAVSRHVLHKRFKQAIGRTVHDEIRRIRVERVATMLRETNRPISKIALDLGYNSAKYIERNFKKEKGITPKQFRKQHSLE